MGSRVFLTLLCCLLALPSAADTLLFSTSYTIPDVSQGGKTVALVVAFGADSIPSGNPPPLLDPVVFLPSAGSQAITITNGTNFDQLAAAFGNGTGTFGIGTAFSFDGGVPASFPSWEGTEAFNTMRQGAVVTSVVITITPFFLDPYSHLPVPVTFDIYAQDPLPPIHEPVPEPATVGLVCLGAAALFRQCRRS